jgi:hypothetical protein
MWKQPHNLNQYKMVTFSKHSCLSYLVWQILQLQYFSRMNSKLHASIPQQWHIGWFRINREIKICNIQATGRRDAALYELSLEPHTCDFTSGESLYLGHKAMPGIPEVKHNSTCSMKRNYSNCCYNLTLQDRVVSFEVTRSYNYISMVNLELFLLEFSWELRRSH